jgi:membrane-associated PAP2 superfamily phosphatase
MSHTLWTAWVCWAVGLAVDMLAHARHRILAVDTKLSEA